MNDNYNNNYEWGADYNTDSGERYHLDNFQSDLMKDRNADSKSKSIFDPTVADLSYATN